MHAARSLAVVALLGLLVACGGEEPLVDDGSQGVPLAGQRQQLEDAGVEVLSADAPASASGADVARALEAVQLVSDEVDDLATAHPIAGLVSARGDTGQFMILVFDGPASAALFAADAATVLTTGAAPATVLAGNVVGVSAQHGPLVRRALGDLAGEA